MTNIPKKIASVLRGPLISLDRVNTANLAVLIATEEKHAANILESADSPDEVDLWLAAYHWIAEHPEFDFSHIHTSLTFTNDQLHKIFSAVHAFIAKLDHDKLRRVATERQKEINAYLEWETYWRGLEYALDDILLLEDPTQYVDLTPELIAEKKRWTIENQVEHFIGELGNLAFVVTHPDFPWERNLAVHGMNREVILSHARKRIEQIKPLALERALLRPFDAPELRPLIFVLTYAQPIPPEGSAVTLSASECSAILAQLSPEEQNALAVAFAYLDQHPEFDTRRIPPYPEVSDSGLRAYLNVFRSVLKPLITSSN